MCSVVCVGKFIYIPVYPAGVPVALSLDGKFENLKRENHDNMPKIENMSLAAQYLTAVYCADCHSSRHDRLQSPELWVIQGR